jgi:hypothetical protein
MEELLRKSSAVAGPPCLEELHISTPHDRHRPRSLPKEEAGTHAFIVVPI